MPDTSSASDTCGLLLCGGAGTRVGGADKGLLPWRDTCFAAAVAARLRPQVASIIIACNRNRERYAELGDSLVSDLREGYCGPLAGIEAAACVSAERIAVAPCDVPHLPLDLVATLSGRLDASGADVAYASDSNGQHYLCAVLRREALATLPGYLDAGGRSVRGWYQTLHAEAVRIESESDAFRNYNSG